MPLLEVCAASLDSAREAAKGGAERIELCCALELDGLTPSEEDILAARQIAGLRLHVLIRPRAGDFVYDESEFATMSDQIAFCKKAGVDGIVIGALTAEGNIDTAHLRPLVLAARPMSVTFHRAFDHCRLPEQAMEDIIALQCDRLLTSGQAPTAAEGIPLLARLHQLAAGRITIMPGAGVNPSNVAQILNATHCDEIHSSARHPGERNTSADVVQQICDAIHGPHGA